MSRQTPPAEKLRVAVERLTTADLVRLQLAALAFDPRRHEDLLQEAITRTLSGKRRWREGVQLDWHLHEVMRSIAWDWAKKRDENLILESQCSDVKDEGGFLAGIAGTTPDPERQTSTRLALERIVEMCGSDPVVVGLVTGKLQGKTGREIRKELNLSEKDFSAAAQRLRRSARALARGGQYA